MTGLGGAAHQRGPSAEVEQLDGRSAAVGLDDTVDAVIDALARHEPATPVVVGPSGAGRTTLLGAVAARLLGGTVPDHLAGRPVQRVRAEAVVGGGRAASLRDLRSRFAEQSVIALDDLEVLLGLSHGGTDLDLRGAVRSLLGRHDILSIATLEAHHLLRLEQADPELAAELTVLKLPELSDDDLSRIAAARAPELAGHHRVAMSAAIVQAAMSPAPNESTRAHPGLMLDRLDLAAARAARRGSRTVELVDLHLDGTAAPHRTVTSDDLAHALSTHIKGQDRACSIVSKRLGLTLADLDLRPHRPDGVFLLIGPSGVGKTQLAKALAHELFGSEEALVRVDMSELAEDHAVSRLYGPPPGYVGSDRPEGWLTSRVQARPRSVVLLDEIEKAHPAVWNAFLQVFDDGRLTDSSGRSVDFSDTVVVMTSNIGSRAFSSNPVGFAGEARDTDRWMSAAAEVRAELARTMAPELLNRIDDVIVFNPLDDEVVVQIAAMEIERLTDRLAAQGWSIRVDDRAVHVLALDQYQPAFGARHILRNLERHLLEQLVTSPKGAYALVCDDTDRLRLDPVSPEPPPGTSA